MPDVAGRHPPRLHLRRWGDEEAPVRALFIHCALAHSGAWSGLAALLAPTPLAAVDLPGHGRSPDLAPGRDLHDESTAGTLAHLRRLGPVHVVGHSFGATVALRLALEHPGLIRSLTLIEPPLAAALRGTAAWDDYWRADAPVRAALAAGRMEEAACHFSDRWGGSGGWAAMTAEQKDYVTARFHLVPRQYPAIHHDRPGLLRPGGLEALSVAPALLGGDGSPPEIGAILDVLEARIPGARRVLIPAAGHMFPISRPEALLGRLPQLVAERGALPPSP